MGLCAMAIAQVLEPHNVLMPEGCLTIAVSTALLHLFILRQVIRSILGAPSVVTITLLSPGIRLKQGQVH
jgi:hypothetical protein